ncbi:MAG: hypothetical protein OCD01_19455 [Fibrobacterales bacterium]
MSFFKKLFGKNTTSSSTIPLSYNPNDTLTVYDEYGRELTVTKGEWVNTMLLPNIKESWNDADALYQLIINALDDGFETEILKAAKQLYTIDSIKDRGVCLYAIVLMKNRLLDKAEAILLDHINTYGKSGVVLTNLAKVYADKEDLPKTTEILWNALEADPNQDNGLDWYLAICNEEQGKSGYIAALNRVSIIPGAWRPYLYLAREALENHNKDAALSYYSKVCTINNDLDALVLQQISGDLGGAGYISEILTVTLPLYRIDTHGLDVGNNIIKAYMELEQYSEAQSLVTQLFSKDRIDWKESLTFWQTELDNAKQSYGSTPDKTPSIGMLSIDEPIWLHKLPGGSTILPSKKESSISIVTIAASCTMVQPSREVIVQKANREGMFCRSIPLSICDLFNTTTSAKATFLLPIVENSGFAFFGSRYKDTYIEQLAHNQSYTYTLLPHLYAQDELWSIEVRLLESTSSTVLNTYTKEFSPEDPEQAIRQFIDEIRADIIQRASLKIESSVVSPTTIAPHLYNHYIHGNENSLSLSMACNIDDGAKTLYGERNIFDNLLTHTLEDTKSIIPACMFISALAKNKAYGSDIHSEYEKKCKKLLGEYEFGEDVSALFENAAVSLYNGEAV